MAQLKDTTINGDLNLSGTLTTNMGGGQHPLLDLIYPVGSVIMTMNSDFAPSTYWGGTWTKWTDGYLKVDGTPNATAQGATNYKITKDMLPKHNHSMNHNHTIGDNNDGYTEEAGNHSHSVYEHSSGNNSDPYNVYDLDHGKTDTNIAATTSTNGNHYHTVKINSYNGATGDGGDALANNVYKPKYYAVIAWQRTA